MIDQGSADINRLVTDQTPVHMISVNFKSRWFTPDPQPNMLAIDTGLRPRLLDNPVAR